jgi:hypothetical protein
MNMAVFWVVAPNSLVEVYRRFRAACCLHRQGPDDGATTQKTAIFNGCVFIRAQMLKTSRRISMSVGIGQL